MIESLDGCNECGSSRVDTEMFSKGLGRVQKQLIICFWCYECSEESRYSTTLRKIQA